MITSPLLFTSHCGARLPVTNTFLNRRALQRPSFRAHSLIGQIRCQIKMGDVVTVTGATGFVATELINQLLQKGYHVRGTVRSLTDKSKVQHLTKLAEALPGTLDLLEADLLKEGSFDEAVAGTKVVFHVASPFFIDTDDAQKDLLDPAFQGTANVLQSVAKAKGDVERVVLTSSVAAVHGEYAAPPVDGKLYGEADWNETSTVENGQAYHLSKTIAEKEAWRIAEKEGLKLVTICPNFVLGPVISDRVTGTSFGYMKGLLEGKPASGTPIICDVRDVARAHILAAEAESASGRYIVSQRGPITPEFVTATLRARFPDYSFPDPDPSPVTADEKMYNERAVKELGLSITPPQSTLVDMATTMLALGLAKPALREGAAKQQKVHASS